MMLEPIKDRPAVERARLLRQVLVILPEPRSREELKGILCDNEPFWAPQTLTAALREALRRKWVVRIEDAYGVWYAAATETGEQR